MPGREAQDRLSELDGQSLTQATRHREELERIVRADVHLMKLLVTARALELPEHRVVAGCIYQTVWNVLTGRPAGTEVRCSTHVVAASATAQKTTPAHS